MNLVANFEALHHDCTFINALPPKHLSSFCNLAFGSIVNGIDTKKIDKAAKGLDQEVDDITNAVRALTQILTMLASASLYVVPEKIFSETLADLNLSKQSLSAIYEFYKSRHNQTRDLLKQFKISTPLYHSFDWRLDIQIGSRAVHRRVDPVYLCELKTTNNNKSIENSNNNNNDNNDDEKEKEQEINKIEHDKTLFECDYANLENMIEQFEQALRETQQSWYKKVSRYTK